MRFTDRVAIVTGGGRGIGAATVRRFAQDGAAVVIADLDDDPARELASDIESSGGQALAVRCDVSQPSSVAALFDAAIERFGEVDFLVMCAGILRFNLVEDVTEEEWDAVIDTHLKGMFLCAQAAARVMVPRRFGKLVLLSSGAARGWRARIHYSAAKAGIEAMTRVLATELGPANINVNAVAPGFVETRMPEQHAAWLGEDYEAFKARNEAQIPLRRVGTPDEQAAVITFLCSEDASYVSGQILSVSGGA
ncbi:MAG: SDR family oxidoreductase [Chloroflexota bacterium]|nr:SDR family oxidoreductase [Chloroflexota bacterium]